MTRVYDCKNVDATTIVQPSELLVYYMYLYYLDKKNRKTGAEKKDKGNILHYGKVLGRSEKKDVSKTPSR